MPSSRRPQRSVAAGVAASGFLVAAVIGAFLVVGGLVTYGVWPTDPAGEGGPAITLGGAAPPLVLPSPPAPAPSEPAAAAGVEASPAVARVVPARRGPTSALTTRRPALQVSPRPPESGGNRPGGDVAADTEAPPAAGGLAPVVDAAESLTAGTARRLRSASVAVEAMTAPLSPEVARIAGDTVDCLADVVEGAGAALAQGLRGVRNLAPPPAGGFPGARPSPDEPPCRLAPRVPGATDGTAAGAAAEAAVPGG